MTFRSHFVSYDGTKQRVIDAYESAANDKDVEMDELKVSLICAISKTPIKTPVRSTTCTHLQCFDLDNFIGTNANRETMKCPICGGEIEASKLVVDKYFQSVLSFAAKENAAEVELLRDGGFRFPKPPVYSALISVSEELIDLSDDEQEQGEAVNAEESVRRVATKTDSTDGPYRRWCVTCEICGKRYKNEAFLSEHKSRAHVPQVASLTCKICDEPFHSETNRDDHEDTAHGEKTFNCDLCEKAFRMRTSRNMHASFCAEKRKAVCKKCGRRFVSQAAAKKHSREHHNKTKTPRDLPEKYMWLVAPMPDQSMMEGASAVSEPKNLLKRAARAIVQAVNTPTSARISRKERRLNNSPYGHCPAPPTLNMQPNTRQSTLPPVFHAYPPPPVPLFPPMMPPQQTFDGFHCPPPYQYGPGSMFPTPYRP